MATAAMGAANQLNEARKTFSRLYFLPRIFPKPSPFLFFFGRVARLGKRLEGDDTKGSLKRIDKIYADVVISADANFQIELVGWIKLSLAGLPDF